MYIIAFEMASDLDPAIDGHVLLGEKFTHIIPPELERPPLRERLNGFCSVEEIEVRFPNTCFQSD